MNKGIKFAGDDYKQAGFTVLELLISIGIIVILTGIFIFNFGLQRQDAALLRSAQKLSLDLRRVQNYALSAQNFMASSVPCGWGIHFNGINSTAYTIFADKAVNVDCSDRDYVRAANGSEDFETANLELGIVVSGLTGGLSDVVFTPPDPLVSFNPSQTSATITLANNKLNTKAIMINKVGLISLP